MMTPYSAAVLRFHVLVALLVSSRVDALQVGRQEPRCFVSVGQLPDFLPHPSLLCPVVALERCRHHSPWVAWKLDHSELQFLEVVLVQQLLVARSLEGRRS